MSSTRPLQRTARLALLAMLLLLAAPLLSQSLAQAQAAPTWLDELACGDVAAAQHGGQPLWAKCGYCTLLLSSPALPGVMLDIGGVTTALVVASALPSPEHFARLLTPHDAPPRAPPLRLS